MGENRVESNNFIVIQGWMLTDLGLKGNELIVYACIYGFSQAEGQAFSGSLRYLADWTNSTKQSVMRCLKSLVEKGYIIKTDKLINGVKFCEYHAKKFHGVCKKVSWGMQKSLPNNIEDNIEDNIGVTSPTPSNDGVGSVTLTEDTENTTSENDDERPSFATVEVYAANNLEWLSPRNMEELGSFKADFPDEVICFAIDEACANGARKWAYVRQMLIGWGERGVRTLGDARAAQERYRADRQKRGTGQSSGDERRAEVSKCLM